MIDANEALSKSEKSDVIHTNRGTITLSSDDKNDIHWYRIRATFICKNNSNVRKTLPIPVIQSFVKNVSQKTSSICFYNEVEMPLFHVKSNEFSSESNPDALIKVDFFFFKQNKEDIFFWRQCLIDYIISDRRYGNNLEIICITPPQKKYWVKKPW